MASLVVIINNFFHDFAAAVWLASFLLLLFFYRQSQKLSAEAKSEEVRQFLARVSGQFSWLIIVSIIVIFLTGAVRTLAYPYGLGQTRTTALIGKHILLLSLAAVTLWWRARLIHRLKQESQ